LILFIVNGRLLVKVVCHFFFVNEHKKMKIN